MCEGHSKTIDANFRSLEEKISFLDELFRNGHSDEALHLCCCYIEAMGNNYYSGMGFGNKKCFVKIIQEYGDDELLCAVHPARLLKSPEMLKFTDVDILLSKVKGRVFSEKEVLELCAQVLELDDFIQLEQNLWRGTLAAIAYEELRNFLVHFSKTVNISFFNTTYRNNTVPDLNFERLYPVLQNILRQMKELSKQTGTWMGRPFE